MSPGIGEVHCFSEDMMRGVRKTMRSIARCECDECRTEAVTTKLDVEVWP